MMSNRSNNSRRRVLGAAALLAAVVGRTTGVVASNLRHTAPLPSSSSSSSSSSSAAVAMDEANANGVAAPSSMRGTAVDSDDNNDNNMGQRQRRRQSMQKAAAGADESTSRSTLSLAPEMEAKYSFCVSLSTSSEECNAEPDCEYVDDWNKCMYTAKIPNMSDVLPQIPIKFDHGGDGDDVCSGKNKRQCTRYPECQLFGNFCVQRTINGVSSVVGGGNNDNGGTSTLGDYIMMPILPKEGGYDPCTAKQSGGQCRRDKSCKYVTSMGGHCVSKNARADGIAKKKKVTKEPKQSSRRSSSSGDDAPEEPQVNQGDAGKFRQAYYWPRRSPSGDARECVHSSDYPETFVNLIAPILFKTYEQCCSAYPCDTDDTGVVGSGWPDDEPTKPSDVQQTRPTHPNTIGTTRLPEEEPEEDLTSTFSDRFPVMDTTQMCAIGPQAHTVLGMGSDPSNPITDCDPSSEFCHHPSGSCADPSWDEGGYILGLCAPKPTVCTEMYEPVCGCDGWTYSNLCKAYGEGVSIIRNGECDAVVGRVADNTDTSFGDPQGGDTLGNTKPSEPATYTKPPPRLPEEDPTSTSFTGPMPTLLDTVQTCAVGPQAHTVIGTSTIAECADDEFCHLRIKSCTESHWVEYGFALGLCAPKPIFCTKDYRPVCGCDGKTHGNLCSMFAMGVSHASDGECGAQANQAQAVSPINGDPKPIPPEDRVEEDAWAYDIAVPYDVLPGVDAMPLPGTSIDQDTNFGIYRMYQGPCTTDANCEDGLVCHILSHQSSGECVCNNDTNEGCSPGKVCGVPPGVMCPPPEYGGCRPHCTCDHTSELTDGSNGCEEGEVCRQPCAMADAGVMCFKSNEERDCDAYGPGFVCRDNNGDGIIDMRDGASGCVKRETPKLKPPKQPRSGKSAGDYGGGDLRPMPDDWDASDSQSNLDEEVALLEHHCDSRKWHESTLPGVDHTCTNDLDYPDEWADLDGFLHYYIDDCCMANFANVRCHLVNACMLELISSTLGDDSTVIHQQVQAGGDDMIPMGGTVVPLNINMPNTHTLPFEDPASLDDEPEEVELDPFDPIGLDPTPSAKGNDDKDEPCPLEGMCRSPTGVCGPSVRCLVSPCSMALCQYGMCTNNYCGGCHPVCPMSPEDATTEISMTTNTSTMTSTTTTSTTVATVTARFDEASCQTTGHDPSGCASGEFCELDNGVCNLDTDGVYVGVCTIVPDMCNSRSRSRSVCGCDGNTYTDKCSAHSSGVSVAHRGECATTATSEATTTALAVDLDPASTGGESKYSTSCRWHIGVGPNLCTNTNSGEYLEAWADLPEDVKQYYFFDTAEECCTMTQFGDKCTIEDVCSAPNEAGASLLPNNANDTLSASLGCEWHMHTAKSKVCTNSLDYPWEWDEDPELQAHFKFQTASACCDAKYPDGDCEIEEIACPHGPAHKDEPSACEWHIDPLEHQLCTNSLDFPEEWNTTEYSDIHFFGSAQDCCDVRYPDMDCTIVHACPLDDTIDQQLFTPLELEGMIMDLVDMPWDFGSPPQWRVDETVLLTGDTPTLTNIMQDGDGATSDLTLRIQVPYHATLRCSAKIHTSMPFDTFALVINGNQLDKFNDSDEETSEPTMFATGLLTGENTVVFRVQNTEFDPGFERTDTEMTGGDFYGSGQVWLDQCRIISHGYYQE